VLFRAVRELLINVSKHANTHAAQVKCRRAGGHLVVTVADSGKGFDARVLFAPKAYRGFGLLTVRERVTSLGGTMKCESIPGDGSRVTLELPIRAATDA